jgi:hypothetical protein
MLVICIPLVVASVIYGRSTMNTSEGANLLIVFPLGALTVASCVLLGHAIQRERRDNGTQPSDGDES